ncbi:TRAP transporter small permease [Treponema sp. OMZ 840]|uniref:TRAP transporter small permease n=1 Tax=Treponema sp. OMZ 840 TaxID=244313 RepID=UPI003D8B64BC
MSKKLFLKIEKWFKLFLGGVVFFWIILENFAIFSRYILKLSFAWSEEVFVLLFIWIIFIGIALASIDDKHIEISILTDALTGNKKLILKIIQNFLLMIFIGVLCWQSYSICKLQISTGQHSAILNLPVWITTLSLVLGATAWLAVMITKTVMLIKQLASKEALHA